MLFHSRYQNKFVYRPFHTSSPRHIPPLLWVFIRPVVKVVALATGRSIGEWYRQLPSEKRSIFAQHLNRNKYRYLGIFGTIGAAFAIHYYTHIETVPITGRKRYMILNSKRLKSLFEMNRNMIATEHYENVLSETSKETQLVARVARQILASNMDIPSISTIKWCARVIDTNEESAFVLPSGDIYVSRGWFKRIKNEDQLAVLIGYELARAILGHTGEEMSYSRILDTLVGVYIIWSLFPSDWTSLCVHYLLNKFIKFATLLPNSRRLVEEADAVGLMLIAKACYDVRESIDFRRIQDTIEGYRETSDYTSAHPARAENLKEMLPWAINLRLQCKCDPLPEKKPRRV